MQNTVDRTNMASETGGDLTGRVALVTGASSGVGRAIAIALSQRGVRLCVVGRNPITLAETARITRQNSRVDDFEMDLTVEDNVQILVQHLQAEVGRLDILIHSAGVACHSPMERARIEDLDLQYVTNVRAPYLMTQRLLPLLAAAGGEVVFINSSAAQTAKRPDVGQYGATKHALKAIADSLRAEVNPKGIRVLSVYLGRTATPMQAAIHREEGKVYHPEALLQPCDVASTIIHAITLPRTAEITDISIRPMKKLN
jgi:NADP-dependent 3-hydroxy acid dehydrogenase YdfG